MISKVLSITELKELFQKSPGMKLLSKRDHEFFIRKIDEKDEQIVEGLSEILLEEQKLLGLLPDFVEELANRVAFKAVRHYKFELIKRQEDAERNHTIA